MTRKALTLIVALACGLPTLSAGAASAAARKSNARAVERPPAAPPSDAAVAKDLVYACATEIRGVVKYGLEKGGSLSDAKSYFMGKTQEAVGGIAVARSQPAQLDNVIAGFAREQDKVRAEGGDPRPVAYFICTARRMKARLNNAPLLTSAP